MYMVTKFAGGFVWLLVAALASSEAKADCGADGLEVASQDNAVPADQKRRDATLRFVRDAKSRTLPVDLSMGSIFLRAELNGEDVWVLVDNAAQSSLIDLATAQSMGLETTARSDSFKTSFGCTKKHLVRGASLHIPTQFVIDTDLIGVDLSVVSNAIGRDIAVVLGGDILDNLAYVLDAENGAIAFARSGTINLNWPGATVIAIENGAMTAQIDGQPTKLGLDLGANSHLLLFRRAWRDYVEEGEELRAGASVDLAGTRVVNLLSPELTLEIGGVSLSTRAKEIDQDIDGIDGFLGYPYFAGKMTLFDIEAGRIVIRN